MKTKKQVITYLYNKNYSYDIVNYCIEKLLEYKLIDDKEYAKRYFETCSKTQGKKLSEYKLMLKGVKKDDIESAMSEKDLPMKEYAKELALKHIKNKERTKENLAKTYRYLIGRGFSYEEANYAVTLLNIED